MIAIIETRRAYHPPVRILLSTLIGRWPDGTPEEWSKISPVGWMGEHGVSPAEAPSHVDALNDQLRGVARQMRVDLLDLAAQFEDLDRSQLQFDWAHMNADGYELMAWSMFAALADRQIITVKDPPARPFELRARYLRKTKFPSTSMSRPEP